MIEYPLIERMLMGTVAKLSRHKVSTTISPTAFAYFQGMIKAGEARNLAEAIDLAIERLLIFENRERLENDTAAYFANLTEEEEAEEKALEAALCQSGAGIDVDS
jgi:hypothetical protein